MNDMDQLREDVRATAPTPRLEFVARMDRAVDAGFAREKRERRRINLWAPSIALACTALIAIVVGLASIDNGDDDSGEARPAALQDQQVAGSGDRRDADRLSGRAPSEPPLQGPSVASLEDASADEFKSGRGNASGQRQRGRGGNRVVEQRTALELETAADTFQEVSDDVLQLADDSGSIVQSSRVSERDGRAFARYDLRVPTSRLDETLADLTRLAHVTSRSSSSQDITRAYVSATDRLDDARAERDALLKALEKADTDVEAEAIRRQIALARNRIAIAQRDVEALQRRADRSKVSVTLRSTGRKSEEGGTWTPGDALGDAGRILEVAAGVVVVTAAALLPVAILALLAALAGRIVRRRRREAALDAT
jgi:hypothetical protein